MCLDYYVASDVDWVADNKDVAVRTVFMHGFSPADSIWKMLDVQQVFATKNCAIEYSGNRLAAVVVEFEYIDSWRGQGYDHYTDLDCSSDNEGGQWTLGYLMS